MFPDRGPPPPPADHCLSQGTITTCLSGCDAPHPRKECRVGDYPRNGGSRHSLLLAGEDALSPAKGDVVCGLAVFTVGAVEIQKHSGRPTSHLSTDVRARLYLCMQRALIRETDVGAKTQYRKTQQRTLRCISSRNTPLCQSGGSESRQLCSRYHGFDAVSNRPVRASAAAFSCA